MTRGAIRFELNQQLLALMHEPTFTAMAFWLAAGVGAKEWHRFIVAVAVFVGRISFRSVWHSFSKRVLLQYHHYVLRLLWSS